MTLHRGDVVLVQFPFASSTTTKYRPALVVQSDRNNARLKNTLVVAITSTTHRSGEPTQLIIEVATATGTQSGLVKDSVVSCENLATIEQSKVVRVIGSLPPDTMIQVNACLKASLDLS